MRAISRLILTAVAGTTAVILFSLICLCGWLAVSILTFANWLPGARRENRVPRERAMVLAEAKANELPINWLSKETTLRGAQPLAGEFVSLRSCPTRFTHSRAESSREAAGRRLKRRARVLRCGHTPGASRFSTDPAKSWARLHRF